MNDRLDRPFLQETVNHLDGHTSCYGGGAFLLALIVTVRNQRFNFR